MSNGKPMGYEKMPPNIKRLWDEGKLTKNHFLSLMTMTDQEMYTSLYKEGYLKKYEIPIIKTKKVQEPQKEIHEKKKTSLSEKVESKTINTIKKLKSLVRKKKVTNGLVKGKPSRYRHSHPVLRDLWDRNKISVLKFQNLALLDEKEMYVSLYKEGYIRQQDVPSKVFQENNVHKFAAFRDVNEASSVPKDKETKEYRSKTYKEDTGKKFKHDSGDEEAYEPNPFAESVLIELLEEGEITIEEFEDYDSLDHETMYERLLGNNLIEDFQIPPEYLIVDDPERQEILRKMNYDDAMNEMFDKKPSEYYYADSILQNLYDSGDIDSSELGRLTSCSDFDMYESLYEKGLISCNDIPNEYVDSICPEPTFFI